MSHRQGWRRPAAAAFFLLCLAAAPHLRAEGVWLTPRLVPGEKVRYRMTLKVDTRLTLNPLARNLADDRPLRLEVDMTWQVETLAVEPDGAARLRAVIEKLTMESFGRAAPAPTEDFVGKAVTYRLRSDGRVDNVEPPDEWLQDGKPPAWLHTWLEQGSGVASRPPDRPLAPGDQWQEERDIQVPGLPSQHLLAESEYLQDEAAAGQPCASVLTRFELRGADTTEPDAAPGTAIDRRVEGGGNRLSCYDHKTGRLRQSSEKSRENIRLEIRDSSGRGDAEPPVVLESTTTTESQLRLVD